MLPVYSGFLQRTLMGDYASQWMKEDLKPTAHCPVPIGSCFIFKTSVSSSTKMMTESGRPWKECEVVWKIFGKGSCRSKHIHPLWTWIFCFSFSDFGKVNLSEPPSYHLGNGLIPSICKTISKNNTAVHESNFWPEVHTMKEKLLYLLLIFFEQLAKLHQYSSCSRQCWSGPVDAASILTWIWRSPEQILAPSLTTLRLRFVLLLF